MFFRTQNLRPLAVDFSNKVYISTEDAERIYKNLIVENDVLMTRTGANFGDTLIFNEDIEAIASSHVFIIRNSRINQPFLGVFLNTLYGREQVNKGMYGGVQPEVAPYYLKNIIFPLLSSRFQELIEKLVKQSKTVTSTSQQVYQQAEDLLLSELGLKDWQPTEEAVAVKSFADSFLSSGRLDAEYYQPKFDQLIERLEDKVTLVPLGRLLVLNQKGRQPDYIDEDQDSSSYLPVINSKYVREGEVILSDNRYAPIPEDNNPLVIGEDDVLFNGTGVGTVGRCATYLHKQPALPDTEVTVLRSNTLDSIYLSTYLNSIAGKLQVEKHLQGSSGIIRVYPNDIAQFLIWDAPKSIQKEIRNKVELSHQKREQSSQLLEIAKTGVERAIETDEETAIAWINQQLENIGVALD